MSHQIYSDFTFKILILGDSGVGKSAILRQYINQTFDTSFMTTIGIDHASKVVSLHNKKVKLSIWDTAGQERFRSITKAYMRGIQCVILVYDVTDQISFDDIERWIEMVQEHSNDQHLQYFIVGNKLDLIYKRVITNDKALLLAKKYNCKSFEVSATNYQSILDLFNTITECLMADSPNFTRSAITPKINISNIENNKKNCC